MNSVIVVIFRNMDFSDQIRIFQKVLLWVRCYLRFQRVPRVMSAFLEVSVGVIEEEGSMGHACVPWGFSRES